MAPQVISWLHHLTSIIKPIELQLVVNKLSTWTWGGTSFFPFILISFNYSPTGNPIGPIKRSVVHVPGFHFLSTVGGKVHQNTNHLHRWIFPTIKPWFSQSFNPPGVFFGPQDDTPHQWQRPPRCRATHGGRPDVAGAADVAPQSERRTVVGRGVVADATEAWWQLVPWTAVSFI